MPGVAHGQDSGRFTKQEVLARITERELRTRRGLVLSPQSFGNMLRNQIYIGLIDCPEYSVTTRGSFEPLVSERTFYRAQAISEGRAQVTAPRERNHPDFPLRGFVRCETCGRPLTGSRSKGRNGYYAYYHCQRQCRAVNVSKAKLEGLFAEELALLQPTPANPHFQRLPDELKRTAIERVKNASNRRANAAARRQVVLEQRRLAQASR